MVTPIRPQGQVSPHEVMQAITLKSENKFQIGRQVCAPFHLDPPPPDWYSSSLSCHGLPWAQQNSCTYLPYQIMLVPAAT